MFDESLGPLLDELQEVDPPVLQNIVDVPIEIGSVGDGQIASEHNAAEAGERGDDEFGKLEDEARQRLHGVLLWMGERPNPF